MVTQTELGWLAGIIDGEGSLYFRGVGTPRHPHHWGLLVVNSDLVLLREEALAWLEQNPLRRRSRVETERRTLREQMKLQSELARNSKS